MIDYRFGIASKYRECFDGISCVCGWGNVDSKGVETCQDTPQNCVFWSEDAEDKKDATNTYKEYLTGRDLKPYKQYREERIFGEHILEAKEIFQHYLVRFWDAWKDLARK